MRVVIDANVWISGFLWGGVPGNVLQRVRERQIVAIASEPLLQELERNFGLPKLQPRMNYWSYTPATLTAIVRSLVVICPIQPIEVPQLRDLNDAIVLATAVAAAAEVIVTGDRDLLVLEEFSGIPILTPAEFLDRPSV